MSAQLDLAVEVPPSELSAVCPIETWQEVYARLAELIREHRSTLVFVNTRRLAERVCHYLDEQLGEGHVASHHGSLSRETRLLAEEQLKAGELKAIVATASLELGIDIGYIDLVCQIGSPRSIATFLQRVGRAGHALGRMPKGRLFALTRDELLEALALVAPCGRGELDRIEMPVAPLDILAQQIVAAVACDEWDEDELFAMCREAWPYRDLTRDDFDAIVDMLSEGIAPGNRSGAYLHRDRINDRLRGRAQCPDRGDHFRRGDSRTGRLPRRHRRRTARSSARSTKISPSRARPATCFSSATRRGGSHYVRGGEVTVRDAHGAPATVPFWLGEARAGRRAVGRGVVVARKLWRATANSSAVGAASRAALDTERSPPRLGGPAADWLKTNAAPTTGPRSRPSNYVAAQGAAIGVVPTQRQVVFERFFDESGGMQLVIHAPFGARINRAWGLALRKCFCRTFDFELQASADDNGIVLSIGPQHSFPHRAAVRHARLARTREKLLDAGAAGRADVRHPLAVERHAGAGRAAAAGRQESAAAAAAVPGRRFADGRVPAANGLLRASHGRPRAARSSARAADGARLPARGDGPRRLAGRCCDEIEAGEIELIARDTREPSPFSHQLLNANPYAFLDDAPLEERRARAVATRRTISVDDVRDLAQLDPEAIAKFAARPGRWFATPRNCTTHC